MPAPLNPNLWAVVLHDENGVPIPASGSGLGTVISSPPDTSILAAATQPLSVPPVGTKRMRVQVTGGDSNTRIRIREAGGTAGTGILLILLGSTMYGGDGGSIAPLEAENVAGPDATVAVQLEE